MDVVKCYGKCYAFCICVKTLCLFVPVLGALTCDPITSGNCGQVETHSNVGCELADSEPSTSESAQSGRL